MNSTEPVTAVLFDLDGVIADSEELWTRIDTETLAHYGAVYHGQYKHEVLGKSYPLAVGFYREAFGIKADLSDMLAKREEIAAKYFATRIGVFPGTHPVLKQLRAAGLLVGLATSSVHACAWPFLERHQLVPYFNAIITGEQVVHGKPNPDIYLLAAEKVGAPPSQCLVIEDALSGIQAGKAAGMRVAAIPDARFVDVRAYEGKADYILSSLSDVPGLIESPR